MHTARLADIPSLILSCSVYSFRELSSIRTGKPRSRAHDLHHPSTSASPAFGHIHIAQGGCTIRILDLASGLNPLSFLEPLQFFLPTYYCYPFVSDVPVRIPRKASSACQISARVSGQLLPPSLNSIHAIHELLPHFIILWHLFTSPLQASLLRISFPLHHIDPHRLQLPTSNQRLSSSILTFDGPPIIHLQTPVSQSLPIPSSPSTLCLPIHLRQQQFPHIVP